MRSLEEIINTGPVDEIERDFLTYSGIPDIDIEFSEWRANMLSMLESKPGEEDIDVHNLPHEAWHVSQSDSKGDKK